MYGYGYRESLTFSIGYGNGYGDVHIPAMILVPVISLFPFKLLRSYIYTYIYIYTLFFISCNYLVCMRLIHIQYIFHLIINFYVIMLIFDGPCCTKRRKTTFIYLMNKAPYSPIPIIQNMHKAYQPSHIIPMNPKTCTHHGNP